MNGKHLYLYVKSAIRTLKGRRREPAAFLVAALCFSGGVALGKLLADKWITRLQIAMYAIGAIAFVYGVVRVWKLVNPPELPPAKDRPSAIKGPMAFTEADGNLFRKLERESELQKLLGFVLDDQILMIVVRGASGAGKTSLLRAGLKHIVGDRALFHYWEAVPTEPDKGLLRAVQERWPDGATKPTTLAELVNPSDGLGRQSHVIVLDQFEQLRGNRKIFQLLRRIVRESKPPHRITWVIAFRREFSADWLDFISPEQENGIRPPQDISVRLFTTEQAREVIGQLIDESDLKDSIEQSVIDNLVEAATVEGEVSPVDIGIGLLVLTELHERQSSQIITKRDYQFAGGAEGLLTQYISRCLEPFPAENKEAILKAMLALRDPEENRQRLATGLTIDDLAVEAGTDARVLKLQLNRLADRDIRLLEADTPADGSAVRYRLPHERLIPALYRLTSKLLAEVDQAKLKFQNAFQAWQTNDKRSRFLLKGKELRLVQRNESQIPWGKDEQEKKSFLFRSKRHRQFVWAATVAAVLVLIAAGWFSILQYQRYEHRRYVTESGYPAELYNFQHQLKKLDLTQGLDLERFTWLFSDSIEELSLKAASSSNSIAGLTSLSRCHSLKKLTLDLRDSQVINLQPLAQLQGLTHLGLELNTGQLSDLQPLEQLKGLTQLTLNVRDGLMSDLPQLEQLKLLPQFTQLTLNLRVFPVSDLKQAEKLKELPQLKQLMLELHFSQVSDLKLLDQLKGLPQLKQLTLDFRFSHESDLKPIEHVKGLPQLTELRFKFAHSEVSDLQPLEQLKELPQLTQLALDLNDSKASDLKPLEQLKELPQLKQLTLDISRNQASNLQSLEQLRGLTHLTLLVGYRQVSDLKPLELLTQLKQLTLDIDINDTRVSNLQWMEQLKGLTQLTQLTLNLSNSQVSDLQPLEQLKGLTQLSLTLSSGVSTLQPLEQLKGLIRLSLNLKGSQVSNLQPLEQLKGMTQLSLSLFAYQVSYLESIQERTSVRSLSIGATTRAQRMSLRSIPASVIELKF